ncbi:MAG: hypothetical protein KDA81_18415, partial [Planctomycetaceae bacterium]|nr:hypothetical protein [Planctomycetaceae bacterium]
KAVDSLTEFVRSGGALIVFPGNRIDVDWYNQRLYSDGRGLLPGQLNEIQDRSKETDVPARIVSQRFEHPALQLFNEPSNGNLSSAEIRQWFRVSTSPGQKSMTAASLNNGDPLLVQHEFGSGVVLLSAIPCDSDWSNLPMQPVFVPLMQQIVTTLASQALPPTNIRAGEPLLAAFPTEETDLPVALKLPDGRQTTVYTSSSGRFQTARYDATEHLGVYSLTAPDASVTHYVADTTRTESDLRFLNEEEIQSVVENCRAVTVHSAADYIEQDRLKRHGREIWKPVLAALLALMFLELILQQRFAKVRT